MNPIRLPADPSSQSNRAPRLALAALALLLGLFRPSVHAAFTVFAVDAEGEDTSQFCSPSHRDTGCDSDKDWTTSSTKFVAQGADIAAINPDLFGFNEWLGGSYGPTALSTFISNYSPGFAGATIPGTSALSKVTASRPEWFVDAGLIGGADFTTTFTCGSTPYLPNAPLQTTLNVPGLPEQLHVFLVHWTPTGNPDGSCRNAKEGQIMASYLASTFTGSGMYAGDAYIVIGDFNSTAFNSTPDSANSLAQGSGAGLDGLSIAPCNFPDNLSCERTDPTDNTPLSCPSAHLDYIMVSSNLVNKLRVSHLYRAGYPTIASDHYPIYCTIGSLNPDVISLSDGSLEVSAIHAPVTSTDAFGNSLIDKDNATPDYVTRASGASGTWSAWGNIAVAAPLPAELEKTIAGINANGIPQEFAVGADHHVYTADKHSGSWGGWTDLSATATHFMVDIAVATNSTGELQLFGIGEDGALWNNWETAANGYTSWNGWVSIGSTGLTAASSLTVGHELNGDLHVFFIGGDKALYHRYWTGSSWSASGSLGGAVRQIALETEASGQLQVWAANSDGSVSRTSETAANAPTSWNTRISTYTGLNASSIAFCFDGNANGAVFFIDGTSGATYRAIYSGGWPSSATSMGGVSDSVSAVLRSDGGIEVFQIGATNGNLYHSFQSTKGGSFSGWQSLGGSEL